MNIKILGFTFRLEILIAIVFIYFVLSGHLFCSCSKVGLRESFTLLKTLGDAPLDYKMGKGVEGSWDTKKQNNINISDSVSNGTQVPLNGTLFFFNNNKGGTKCNTNYSTSDGCISMTAEQGKYLNSRGGNRIMGNF